MIYVFKNKEMPWASYGEILWQGIYYFDKKKKEHCLLRTAPFCPGIYRSQYDKECPVIIVREYVKEIMEDGFSNFNFVEIRKERIVNLDWQTWDLSADEPKMYPSGDMDAEEYITRRKHNELLSQTLGNLYALIPEKEGYAYYDENEQKEKLVKSTLSTKDIFIVDSLKNQEIYVSEKIKSFLEVNFSSEIYLEPAILGEPENLEEVRKIFLWREILKEKSEQMSVKDWQKWHGLKNKAQKLVEGMGDLKSENAKIRRKEKILFLLNQANEIYPLNTEKWMRGFWEET